MPDINPFEALGDLISGKVFDGPEEAPKSTSTPKVAADEPAAEKVTHEPAKRRKPAPSIDHIFEPDDERPRKRAAKAADRGTDAVAAEEAATEGEGKAS